MSNVAILRFEIHNCLECPYSKQYEIITPDSWDHEKGCFCTKVEDNSPKDLKPLTNRGYLPYKCVAIDDWHLEKYTDTPDWCPYLERNTHV